jgi:uncharacterized coiled-coil protein SlyX
VSDDVKTCLKQIRWHGHDEAADTLESRIADLEAKLAASEKDAERLEFMIKNGARVGWFRCKCKVETATESLSDWHDDAISAIDAAIAQAAK